MTTGAASLTGGVVLLAHNDLFEIGYLKAVLLERGMTVLGPFPDIADTLNALTQLGPHAAIIANVPEHQAPGGLAEQLQCCGIPYLILTRANDRSVPEERPMLRRPFAAYQVADWITEMVAIAGVPRGNAVVGDKNTVRSRPQSGLTRV